MNTQTWIAFTSSRNPQLMTETMMPIAAANNRRTTKLRLRRIAAGSIGAAGGGAARSVIGARRH